MARRNELLDEYLREIARDLIARGVIRRQRYNQDLLDIAREEPSVIVGTILRDLKDAGVSVGTELIKGGVEGFLGALFGSRG